MTQPAVDAEFRLLREISQSQSRMRLLDALWAAAEGLSNSELKDALNITQSTVRHHLLILMRYDLVEHVPDSNRYGRYKVRRDTVKGVVAALVRRWS